MLVTDFEPLEINSKELDEVAEYVNSAYAPVNITRLTRQPTYGIRGRTVRYSSIFLEHSTTIGGFRVTPTEPHNMTLFNFMYSDGGVYQLGSNTVELRSNQLLAYRMADHVDVLDGSSHTTVTLCNDAIQKRLSELLDAPVSRKVKFHESPLDQALFGPLLKLVKPVNDDSFLEYASFIGSKSSALEKLIIDFFLFSLPNDFSEKLSRKAPNVAPRHVKRAIEYIQAHSRTITSPELLAAISNVSVRSLQYSFKAFTGQTISEYQLLIRLAGAREDVLLNHDLTLREIAQRWAFSSHSSFTKAFIRAYGEMPSQVRKSNLKS